MKPGDIVRLQLDETKNRFVTGFYAPETGTYAAAIYFSDMSDVISNVAVNYDEPCPYVNIREIMLVCGEQEGQYIPVIAGTKKIMFQECELELIENSF